MKHHNPNPDPDVPCLFCDASLDDTGRRPTPWRTPDGYALCQQHAEEHDLILEQENW